VAKPVSHFRRWLSPSLSLQKATTTVRRWQGFTAGESK
jgi:hypothetical protein